MPNPVSWSLLREKARWYLGAGVTVVWMLIPESRDVVVLSSAGESRLSGEDRLPEVPGLPGLQPRARDLFLQIESRG